MPFSLSPSTVFVAFIDFGQFMDLIEKREMLVPELLAICEAYRSFNHNLITVP